jgi:hypothetical protein
MFEERFVGEAGEFRLRIFDDRKFSLACSKGRETLVEYKPGQRVLRGRAMPYEFKSVEQLRYDFERDAEDALRQG